LGGPQFWQAEKSAPRMKTMHGLHIRRKGQNNCRMVTTTDWLFSRFTHKLRFIQRPTRSWCCGTLVEVAFFHDKNPNKRPQWSEHNDLGRIV
jgi:hypothetical protein